MDTYPSPLPQAPAAPQQPAVPRVMQPHEMTKIHEAPNFIAEVERSRAHFVQQIDKLEFGTSMRVIVKELHVRT